MNTLIAIMERVVPVVDILAFVAAVVAVLFIRRGWKCRLSIPVRLAVVGIAAVLVFHNLSDALESLKITTALDVYEDYIEIVFSVLYFLTVFIFWQERGLAELRESEERHRKIYEVAAEGILIADVKTRRFRYANPAICRMLGYTEKELERMGLANIHPKEALPHVVSEFKAQARREKTLVTDIPCLRKDGTVFSADVSVGVAEFEGRKHSIGFFTDTTERKCAEEALRASEQQLRAANQQLRASEQQLSTSNERLARVANEWQMTFDASNDAIWIVDSTNHILRSNKTAERLFSGSGKLAGRHCWEIVHKTSEPVCGCPLVKAQKSLMRETMELQLGDRWYQVTVDPIIEGKTGYAGAVHMVADITMRKLAENEIAAKTEQLQAANQQLLASEQQLAASYRELTVKEGQQETLLKTLNAKNKELESIVYAASHDLRSPLVNIEGFGAELNKNCAELADKIRSMEFPDDLAKRVRLLTEEDIPECIRFISASTEKVNVLLDGLLQVCRVGTAKVRIERLDLNSMFAEIVETFRFKAKECRATITVEKVPDCLADEVMTYHVFSNLVDNALKYLDSERPGQIHIRGWTEGSACHYCVEDNGIGIAKAHTAKIFEVFHRLNPGKPAGGEGLGLTIVLRAVERLNGHIDVESEPGKGSRFLVTLPAVS